MTRPSVSTDPVSCRICQANAPISLRYHLASFDVYECGRCGLRFRHPLPGEAELIEMYEDPRYHETPYFRNAVEGAGMRSPEVRIYERALGDLAELGKRGALLDVGCGTGFFLQLARKRGWEVAGVELSERHRAYARATFGLEVWGGDFLAAPAKARSFDVITMWDFLEHVLDPRLVVARARELLKRDGVLLVFTIDTTSLFNLAGDLAYRLSGRRARRILELLYDSHHNYYFTLNSLSRLLSSEGLTVERWRSDRAYLSRWVTQPAPWYLLAGGFLIDLLSLPLDRPYRRTAYCRPKGD